MDGREEEEGTEARRWGEVKAEQRSAEMMECNDSRTAPSQPPKTSGCHWPDDIRTNYQQGRAERRMWEEPRSRVSTAWRGNADR